MVPCSANGFPKIASVWISVVRFRHPNSRRPVMLMCTWHWCNDVQEQAGMAQRHSLVLSIGSDTFERTFYVHLRVEDPSLLPEVLTFALNCLLCWKGHE